MTVYDPNNSRPLRALNALPFLTLTIFSIFCMNIISLVKNFDPPSITGRISWDGGSIPILQRFHVIPFLDDVFRDVTVGFAPSTLEYDPPMWWQLSSFLNDAGVVYMVTLLEGLRAANRGTIVALPALMGTIAQLGGGGAFIPLYYFLYLVFCPPIALQSSADRRIDTSRALIYLPLMLVFYYAPLVGMYLSPSFEARHYWTWAWQLYCVRIALGYYVVRLFDRVLPLNVLSIGKKMGYHTALRITLGPLILISAAVWINMLVNCPYSFSTLFLPVQSPDEPPKLWIGMMRRCLQYDELFVFWAAFLWLLYLAGDLRKAGIWEAQKVSGLFALFALVGVVGPGATLGVVWLWMERDTVDDSVGEKSSVAGVRKGL